MRRNPRPSLAAVFQCWSMYLYSVRWQVGCCNNRGPPTNDSPGSGGKQSIEERLSYVVLYGNRPAIELWVAAMEILSRLDGDVYGRQRGGKRTGKTNPTGKCLNGLELVLLLCKDCHGAWNGKGRVPKKVKRKNEPGELASLLLASNWSPYHIIIIRPPGELIVAAGQRFRMIATLKHHSSSSGLHSLLPRALTFRLAMPRRSVRLS